MVTGLRTPGVASPLQKQYLTKLNKDSIVFRLRLTCIRVWWGGFTLIPNRIPLLQVQSHTHPTDRMLSPCWSMGHPCSIQRGLARRLCILLVCTPQNSTHPPRSCEPRPTRMNNEMKEATQQGKSWLALDYKRPES